VISRASVSGDYFRNEENVSNKRREVVSSISDAAAQIKDGMTDAIGGFGAENHPMALVREIIRNGRRNLTVVASATAGLEIDLLIGAGCVRKLLAPYVGQEMYCPIGHNLRKYAESGQIEIWVQRAFSMPDCLPRLPARILRLARRRWNQHHRATKIWWSSPIRSQDQEDRRGPAGRADWA
jgi:acyl-CoA hydrolase